MKMNVETRDQWETLTSDWHSRYAFTLSENPDDPLPCKAAPHCDPGAVLEATSPHALRQLVAADDARRTAAGSAREAG